MAKKFDFRLQSVLNLRTYKVGEAKDALNFAVKSRVQKETAISECHTQKSELFRIQNNSSKAADFQAKYNHINHLDFEISRLEKEKVRMQEIENLRRGHLSKALKEEKVLVKLKEKKQVAYKYQLDQEEIKSLDEIANNNRFHEQ